MRKDMSDNELKNVDRLYHSRIGQWIDQVDHAVLNCGGIGVEELKARRAEYMVLRNLLSVVAGIPAPQRPRAAYHEPAV